MQAASTAAHRAAARLHAAAATAAPRAYALAGFVVALLLGFRLCLSQIAGALPFGGRVSRERGEEKGGGGGRAPPAARA